MANTIVKTDYSELEARVFAHMTSQTWEKSFRDMCLYGTTTGRWYGKETQKNNQLEDTLRYVAFDKHVKKYIRESVMTNEKSGSIIEVKFWIDSQGNRKEISTMSEDHIINCVKLLSKWRKELKEVLKMRKCNTIEDRVAEYERSIKIFIKELNKRA